MFTLYTQNENCYVLTNFSDSNNPMFIEEVDERNFKGRIDEKLSVLCEILGYTFHNDQFLILVVLRDRATFVNFYREKKDDMEISEEEVPESTYILSQEMANIQSGYALWFNKKYKRYGSLFGRRYTKLLIETEESLREWVNRMKDYVRFWDFEEFWNYVMRFVNRLKKLEKIRRGVSWVTRTELECSGVGERMVGALSLEEFSLRGRYVPKPLPPILAAKSTLPH